MNLLEVNILTNNISETEKFYAEILGFKTIFKSEEQIKFKIGASILVFVKTELKNPRYHFAFEIPQNLLDDAIEWLSKKVELITVDGAVIVDFESWKAKAIYFYDNNGNLVELILRHDNNITQPKPFDLTKVLSISEIGVVTDKPLLLAEEIVQKFKLPYYSKGPKRKDFVAIGSEKGLLLITQTDRIWFPTKNLKAEKAWVKVVIENEGEMLELEYNGK